ncbi:hypothetical protein BASA61_008183 [Batrachochytrium salamandrivorans]|nr:hypothetical protein BASA60_007983 [Batrachochytrium salamandrivorans]KAH6583091.1 hypothetical protein BASA61_008183 [Batrachochytrium salamandrivorans]
MQRKLTNPERRWKNSEPQKLIRLSNCPYKPHPVPHMTTLAPSYSNIFSIKGPKRDAATTIAAEKPDNASALSSCFHIEPMRRSTKACGVMSVRRDNECTVSNTMHPLSHEEDHLVHSKKSEKLNLDSRPSVCKDKSPPKTHTKDSLEVPYPNVHSEPELSTNVAVSDSAYMQEKAHPIQIDNLALLSGDLEPWDKIDTEDGPLVGYTKQTSIYIQPQLKPPTSLKSNPRSRQLPKTIVNRGMGVGNVKLATSLTLPQGGLATPVNNDTSKFESDSDITPTVNATLTTVNAIPSIMWNISVPTAGAIRHGNESAPNIPFPVTEIQAPDISTNHASSPLIYQRKQRGPLLKERRMIALRSDYQLSATAPIHQKVDEIGKTLDRMMIQTHDMAALVNSNQYAKPIDDPPYIDQKNRADTLLPKRLLKTLAVSKAVRYIASNCKTQNAIPKTLITSSDSLSSLYQLPLQPCGLLEDLFSVSGDVASKVSKLTPQEDTTVHSQDQQCKSSTVLIYGQNDLLSGFHHNSSLLDQNESNREDACQNDPKKQQASKENIGGTRLRPSNMRNALSLQESETSQMDKSHMRETHGGLKIMDSHIQSGSYKKYPLTTSERILNRLRFFKAGINLHPQARSSSTSYNSILAHETLADSAHAFKKTHI